MCLLEVSECDIFLRHFAAWEECARRHMEFDITAHRLLMFHEEHIHYQLELVHAFIRQIIIVFLLH